VSDQSKICAELIKQSQSIAALTGAGISTNAGIPDFRGPQGLYVTKRYDPEKVFDINYFCRDQKPFFEFAKDFLELETKIKPTFTHQFLARLEKEEKLIGIVTQNIDSLHQLAGSKKVLEMHGSFWNSFCLDCNQKFSFEEMKEKIQNVNIPLCECGGVIKPDIVFFGENVKFLTESFRLAHQADLFFVIGTSCIVYPAASVPQYAQGKIVVINKDKVDLDLPNVALEVEGDSDEFFKEVAKYL
jgi:NAD-dependent deacetylase